MEQRMQRERQQEAGFKSGRHARKEWGQGGDEQHQMEAREHARQPGRTQRTHDVREAEAERQIRELRGRY
jgi:hypothetical protein